MKALSIARDLKRRKARERTGLFVAEGVRCVEELLASPVAVKAILVSPALRQTPRGAALESVISSLDGSRGAVITELSDAELSEAASTDTPQGIICVAVQPERSFENIDTRGIVLLLDGVQDPGNVGTMLRTALAFGVVATVALPGTVDLWNPKVVRSAMGALFSHHAFHADVSSSLKYLTAASIPLWATNMSGAPVGRLGAGNRVAIVVGNEGGGVSSELAAAAIRNVTIPVSGVESLNVAVATGIILYALTTP